MTLPQTRFDFPPTSPPPSDLGRVHFVAIGGAGMSGVARILLAKGVPVSGSDAARVAPPARAARRGRAASTSATTRPSSTTSTPSSSRRPSATTTSSCAAARTEGLRVLHRAQALASLDGRVAPGGRRRRERQDHDDLDAHRRAAGAAGVDPSFAVGGELAKLGTNAAPRDRRRASSSRPTRATARSSSTGPRSAIVTNVQPDHLDFYGDLASGRGGLRRLRRHDRPGRPARRLRRRRRGAARSPTSRASQGDPGADLRRVARRRRCACPVRCTAGWPGPRS